MTVKRGLFITLEGGEGAGKTTQSQKLKAALEQKGFQVITTREPGGTPESEKIRDLLVQRDGGNWTPLAECLLLYAARQMHVANVIKPAIDAGKIVICDRFADSTRAYQGYGHGFDLNKIDALHHLVLGGFEPDLTFIFDLPPDEGLKRSKKQKNQASGKESTEDRMENMDFSFHDKLRQGFLSIANAHPERCYVVNALHDLESIGAEILATVESRLKHVV